MKAMKIKRSSAIVDTGLILTYLSMETNSSKKKQYIAYLEQEVFENPQYDNLAITPMTKTELLYIICRTKGWNEAQVYTDLLLSNFVIIRNTEVEELAALIKCKVSVALVDCYVVATGSLFNLPVYFLEERELTQNVQNSIKEDFKVDLKVLRKF